MTKTRAEQETIIRRSADEQGWDLFTEDPRVLRKLQKLYGEGKPHGLGVRWLLPQQGVSFRRPRALSTQARESSVARLKAARDRKAQEMAGS